MGWLAYVSPRHTIRSSSVSRRCYYSYDIEDVLGSSSLHQVGFRPLMGQVSSREWGDVKGDREVVAENLGPG